MSALWINIQYGLTVRLANELSGQAKQIKAASDNGVCGIRNAIAANWKGENGVKYSVKLETLEGKISNNARELDRTAATIRTMAENYRRAELRAIAIAKKRDG